ncbi:MAG: DUF4384 domain-containing protein [Thermodesulfobacteriota bacterium]
MKNKTVLLLSALLLYWSGAGVVAAQSKEQEIANARSLLCIVNGYAYSTTGQSEPELEEAAGLAAVKLAEKKITAYLETHISGSALFEIRKKKGKGFRPLRKHRVDSATVGDNLVGMRLAGVVEYEVHGSTPGNLLTLGVNTDKSVYSEGDELVFNLESNRDLFMCLVEQAPDNSVTQLLPNSFKPEERFAHGNSFFPNEQSGDKFKFIIGPPFGNATVHMYGSDEPIGGIAELDEQSGYFIQTSDTINQIRDRLMGKILDSMELDDAGVSFQCAQFTEARKKLTLKP